ncbi:MAG TPA: hypothetical protein VFV50_17955 [Bdellovibrionales bacterium]|nr:hypothetical protein [Bdellovibrionales bacterium]
MELKNNLSALLKDAANVKHKKTLLKVSELPECESDENSDGCIEALAQGMAAKYESRLVSGQTTMGLSLAQGAKLSDLTSILEAQPFKDAAAKFVEAYKAKAGEAEIAARAEKDVFGRVKDVMVLQIQESVAQEAARTLLVERIKALQWGGSNCGPDGLTSIMTPEVFLSMKDNKVYFCRGVSRLGNSEYHLAYLIAREMAHFVGPCGVTRGKNVPLFKYSQPNKAESSEQEFPFKGVLTCLRGRTSAYAQRGLGLSRESAVLCDKSDQISETFADWLAAEVMSDYIPKYFDKHSKQEKKSGVISLMRSQCTPGTRQELADRIPVEERFNRILLSNPDIRTALGCKVKPLDIAYCAPGAESDDGTEEKSE